jgi:hypothetical protein
MIRRQVGDEFWLITQDDHAQISGELAQAIGNANFSPTSSASAILGIALHDCGWPLHDNQPTLNGENLPLDVFESPREIGLHVWEASAERAAQRDDYAGLLVSLHSLGLSVFVTEQTKWNLDDPRGRFEMNRFQHKMVELQESLRQRLGMKNDRPLKNGLAMDTRDPKEQKLLFDFRWLGAMDRLSLAICCTQPPFDSMEILPRIGEPASGIKMVREGNEILLDPWPLAKLRIEIEVPHRRLPAKKYTDVSEFRAAYAAAPIERFTAAVRGRNI